MPRKYKLAEARRKAVGKAADAREIMPLEWTTTMLLLEFSACFADVSEFQFQKRGECEDSENQKPNVI